MTTNPCPRCGSKEKLQLKFGFDLYPQCAACKWWTTAPEWPAPIKKEGAPRGN